jgi:hypothetical protein
MSDADSPDSVSCADGNKQEAGAPTPTLCVTEPITVVERASP